MATAAIVSLSVDPLAFAPFTPIKTSLIQATALLLAVPIAKSFRSPRPADRTFSLLLLFLVTVAVSTLFSVDRTRLAETSPVFSQSFSVLLSCAVLFWGSRLAGRHDGFVDALLRVLWATSIPVCLLMWLQRFGWPQGGVFTSVYGSMAGGPIFLAGYLLFLIPITVLGLSKTFSKDSRARDIILPALALLLQVGAFLLCEKRGPFLGLVAAALTALLLLAAMSRELRWVKLACRLFLVVTAALLVLTALYKCGIRVDRLPGFGRLAKVIDVGKGTGSGFRNSLWRELPGLATANPPLVSPDGQTDPHHQVRPLIGYGPDTVEAILPTRWITLPDWPHFRSIEVSCHSLFWDTALSVGLLGLLAFPAFFLSILWSALAALGLVESGWRSYGVGLAWALGGASIAGTLMALVYHPGFFGLGAMIGFVAGAGARVATVHSSARGATVRDPWILIALIAALVGHWVDMAFVFYTGNTAFLFWLLGGTLLALASNGAAADKRPEEGRDSGSLTDNAKGFVAGACGAAAFLALLPRNPEQWSISLGDQRYGLLPAMAFGILSMAVTRLALAENRISRGSWFRSFIPLTGVILVVGLLGSFFRGNLFPDQEESIVFVQIWGWVAPTLLGFTAIAISARAFWAVVLSRPLVALPATALIVALIAVGPVRWIQSEAASGLAQRVTGLPTQTALFEEGLRLRPENFRLRMAYADAIGLTSGPDILGLDVLRAGISISPFNLLSLQLGSALTEMLAAHPDLAEEALAALEAAGRYIPQNENAWFLAAYVADRFLGDTQNANRLLSIANGIAAPKPPPALGFNATSWAEFYAGRAFAFRGTGYGLLHAHRAIEFAQMARSQLLKMNPSLLPLWERENWKMSVCSTYISEARARQALGDASRALELYKEAVKWKPPAAAFDLHTVIEVLEQASPSR